MQNRPAFVRALIILQAALWVGFCTPCFAKYPPDGVTFTNIHRHQGVTYLYARALRKGCLGKVLSFSSNLIAALSNRLVVVRDPEKGKNVAYVAQVPDGKVYWTVENGESDLFSEDGTEITANCIAP
jgi:hypothetical protein